MSLDYGRSRLHNAHKTLREHWEDTKMNWHDVVRKDFEEDMLDPIEPRLSALTGAIDRLGQVFLQVKQECEEE